MSLKDIIDDVIRREGGEKATNDDQDKGGRTQYGISEKSHPGAWQDGSVSREEAEAIYAAKYVTGPGFDRISDSRLQAQMVDFGVTSGPAMAIQKVQSLVGQEPDGVLGPKTIAAIQAEDPILLNNKLALERVKMIGRIVNKNPSQAKFLNGWLSRALDFMRF